MARTQRGRIGARARTLIAIAAALLAPALAPAAASAAETVVDAGELRAEVEDSRWGLTFTDSSGRLVLGEHPGTSTGPTGTLGFRSAGVWRHATTVESSRREGAAWIAELATTDPARRLSVRIAPDGRGVIALRASVTPSGPDVEAVGIGFRARDAGERYLGFGERSNRVDQRGQTVESFVGEGPYQQAEYPLIASFVPPWGYNTRADATYFPMPWLVSTRGFGVLVDNTERSLFRLGSEDDDSWSVEADARELRLRVFAGPRPHDVVRRLTERIGRQPEPAAPWFLGAWWQPVDAGDQAAGEQREARMLRKEDVPVSVTQQSLHYLPCGDHVERRELERERTRFMHAQGMAMTAYFNSMICADYEPAYGEAVRKDVLVETPAGAPFTYAYLGFLVSMVDFTAPGATEFFGSLLKEAVDDGYDGWMEDFGEYVPPASRSANGMSGAEMHNFYPVPYHCAAWDFVRGQSKPLARFIRSGWTGVHGCAQLVWGGDPSSTFGFDGLRSALKNGLTMGLSGISLWGSDIGGFFELTTQLSPELLKRWIQFGAVSGFMETRARGIDGPPRGDRIHPEPRPQLSDPDQLAHYRRHAKLRTQLYPYIAAADAEYRRTGMPIMRHHSLVNPADERAAAREDQFMFGPDLLAAPVVEEGARNRSLYLPAGRWVDLNAATDYQARPGALKMGRARLVGGGRSVTVPAPLDELPLMVRAGAVLPLLPPEVDTLADFGDSPAFVTLRERRTRIDLLAFPRGRTVQRLAAPEGTGTAVERVVSTELPGRRWRLSLNGRRARQFELSASLATLRRPFEPCRVLVGRRELPRSAWSYDARTRVLRARFSSRRDALTVDSECGSPRAAVRSVP